MPGFFSPVVTDVPKVEQTVSTSVGELTDSRLRPALTVLLHQQVGAMNVDNFVV